MQLPLLSDLVSLATRWKSILDPLLANPINSTSIVQPTPISLAIGNNTINHKLGRQPQGWFIVDITAASDIYRVSWSDKTIVLNSSALTTIKLGVF